MSRSQFVAMVALIALPSRLGAQVGLAARASTLGIGAELTVRPSRYFGLRLGGNYFQLSGDVTIESNRYTATPHFENGSALLDLYPFGGPFHLSGGVILNYNEGRLVADLPVTIDGRTYSPEQVSELGGSVTFNRAAPYLGIGLAGESRITVVVDLGVGLTGTPIVGLNVQSSLEGAERTELDARIGREQERVQAEINRHSWLKYHPVLSLGLKLGF